MKDLTAPPLGPDALRLSRRALMSALVTLTAAPPLTEEAWALPQGNAHAAPPSVAAVPRRLHTATTLGGGMVLVAGGYQEGPLADCQVFNAANNRWYNVAPMKTPRAQHAAVALGDGRILVLGGFYHGALADAEIYHFASDTWRRVEPMAFPRYDHSAALLGDGSVLIYGGAYEGVLDAPEIYNP